MESYLLVFINSTVSTRIGLDHTKLKYRQILNRCYHRVVTGYITVTEWLHHGMLAVIIVIIAIKRCRDERGLHADPVSRNASSTGVRRVI